MSGSNAVERALELARTGPFRTIHEIRKVLIREKVADAHAHLAGAGLQMQLREIIAVRLASERQSNDT